jgi:methylglyoxal synthase
MRDYKKPKRIALIAHDGKKQQMVEWAAINKELLSQHFLSGTGTTGTLIQQATGLPIKLYKSGPLGGDQQIGALIADGELDILIFLWDPLEAQPHDVDVKALLRLAVVYDIPVANNLATADCIISMYNED